MQLVRKFSKIFETKDDVINLLNISEDEIKDICQEVIDDFDFIMNIESVWISKTGKIFTTDGQAFESYPTILIELKRSIESDDPRNWDGGIYYESDDNILKKLFEMICRIKSLCEDKGIKILYSIRSINQINIRISAPIKKSEINFDREKIQKLITNNIRNINLYHYTADVIGVDNNTIKVKVFAKSNDFNNDFKKMSTDIDAIIFGNSLHRQPEFRLDAEGNTVTGYNNLKDMSTLSNILSCEIHDMCREDLKSIKMMEYKQNYDGTTDVFMVGEKKLMSIEYSSVKIPGEIRVTLPDKDGFFKKPKILVSDIIY